MLWPTLFSLPDTFEDHTNYVYSSEDDAWSLRVACARGKTDAAVVLENARREFVADQPAGTNGADMGVFRDGAGDGTVPRVSAMCPQLVLARPAETAGNAVHQGVYSDPMLQDIVRNYIRMLLAIPPGTSLPDP